MADDIDRMLQGDDTTQASQAGNGQQDDSIQRIEQQTEEEAEFNNLSGSTQDRIKELIRQRKDAEREKEDALSQRQMYQPQQQQLAPDQQQALETLSRFGIATDEKVDEKVNQGLSQIKWELRMSSLEQKYGGSNGEPKYDREEVEDYIKSHPQYKYYDPEDVFKFKMFPDEFSSMGQQQQTSQQRSRPSSMRPVRSNQQVNPLGDMETLQRRLAEPDGDQYYEDHKDEINRAVAEYTTKFKGTNLPGQ